VNVASDSIRLRSIEFAKIAIDIKDRDKIVVGKDKHSVLVKVLDKDGQVLTLYNGVMALDFPKLSGSFSQPFVSIKNGVSDGDIFFTPGYVAEKDLRIQAQVPGINTIEGDLLTILPDVPMNFEFIKAQDRMEARTGNFNKTRATLYDRYGNIAYNTTGYKLTTSLPQDSKKYASVSSSEHIFTDGSLDFDIEATAIPGKAYIIGTITPALETNSFTITDKSSKTLTVSGVSKNVTLLDTYYLFNKSKLATMKYDAQYSVLL